MQNQLGKKYLNVFIRRNEVRLLAYRQDSIKIQSVGRQNKFFSSQFLGLTIWKEKNFFAVNKEEKPVIISVQSIYSLYNKIEEHS